MLTQQTLPGKPCHISSDDSRKEFEIALARLKELTLTNDGNRYLMSRFTVDGTQRFIVVCKPTRH